MIKNVKESQKAQETSLLEQFDNLNQQNFQDSEPINPIKIGKEKGKKKARSIRKTIDFWRKKVAQEEEQIREYDYYDEEDSQEERQKAEAAQRVAVDIDRKSGGKSPPAMLPKDQVKTDSLEAPKSKKKKSFRKRIRKRFSKFGRRK